MSQSMNGEDGPSVRTSPPFSTDDAVLTTRAIVVGSGIAAYLSASALAVRGFNVTLFSNATLPVYSSMTSTTPSSSTQFNSFDPSQQQQQQESQRTPTKSPRVSPRAYSSAASPGTPGGSSGGSGSAEARYVSLCAAGTAALTRFEGLEKSLKEAREKTRLSGVSMITGRRDSHGQNGYKVTEIANGVHASMPFAAAAADSRCSSYATETQRVNRLSGRTSVEAVSVSDDACITLALLTSSGRTTLRTRLLVAADGDAPWSILWHLRQKSMSSHLLINPDDLVLKAVRSDGTTESGTDDQQSERSLRRTLQISADEANLLVSTSRALVFQPVQGVPSDRLFQLYVYPSFAESQDRVASVHAAHDHTIWSLGSAEPMYDLFDENFPYVNWRKLITSKAMWSFVESRAKPILRAQCLRTPAIVVGPNIANARRAADRNSTDVSGILFVGRSARVLPPDAPASLDSTLVDAATVADAVDSVLARKADSDGSVNASLRSLAQTYNELRADELKALVQVVSQVESLRGDACVENESMASATTTTVSRKLRRGAKQAGISERLRLDLNHSLINVPSFVDMIRKRRNANRRATVGASIVMPTVAAGLIRLVMHATTRLLGGGRGRGARRRLIGGGGDSDSDSDSDSDGDD